MNKMNSAVSSQQVFRRKAKKHISATRVLFIISFIIVPIINFAVFYVYVNIDAFLMAFQLRDSSGRIVWTFDNFIRLFDEFKSADSEISLAAVNTLITFAITMAMFFVGFFVSYFLYKRIFLHNALRIMLFLPSIVVATLTTAFYKELVSVNGPLADFFQNLFHLNYKPDVLAEEKFANLFVFINLMWLSVPSNMILWGGAFSRINESIIESAKLDGVNWLQEAFRIIIPIIWPTFSLLLLLSIVGLFGATGNVFLLTGGGVGTMTLSVWMFTRVYNVSYTAYPPNGFHYLSAVGLFFTTLSVALVLIIRTIADKFFSGVEY